MYQTPADIHLVGFFRLGKLCLEILDLLFSDLAQQIYHQERETVFTSQIPVQRKPVSKGGVIALPMPSCLHQKYHFLLTPFQLLFGYS